MANEIRGRTTAGEQPVQIRVNFTAHNRVGGEVLRHATGGFLPGQRQCVRAPPGAVRASVSISHDIGQGYGVMWTRTCRQGPDPAINPLRAATVVVSGNVIGQTCEVREGA